MKSLLLEMIEHNDPPRTRDERKIKHEFKLGGIKYSAPSDPGFYKEFTLALLKHQHEKVEYPRLDEAIYGRKFISQVNTFIRLHNHPFWEED